LVLAAITHTAGSHEHRAIAPDTDGIPLRVSSCPRWSRGLSLTLQ
jgi:hypothetical protein